MILSASWVMEWEEGAGMGRRGAPIIHFFAMNKVMTVEPRLWNRMKTDRSGY